MAAISSGQFYRLFTHWNLLTPPSASHDILRLYDLQHEQSSRHSTVPFLIIPGHRTGTISQLFVDNACRFMISTSGNRGWEGNSTEVLLGYEIGVPQY
jgi:transcriptional activator SPT8